MSFSADPDDGEPASEEQPLTAALPFPVVGIGASAGGLAAIEALFAGMPAEADIGMAFVIVQHLSPKYKSLLTELVGRYTRMQVSEVTPGTRIAPNRVYIIPPDRDMVIEGDCLQLQPPASPHGHRLPIDHFLQSLALAQRERAIAIILSGTGSDGTHGVRVIKAEGGMVIAQEPGSAQYDGMPRSAIRTNLVDYILPPEGMAEQLIGYTRQAFTTPRPEPDGAEQDAALHEIIALLRSGTGHDFSQYKDTTLVRRIQRRVALQQLAGPTEYATFIRENPAEIEALFRDLLIGVTNFFRDPDAFAVLAQRVIAKLLSRRTPEDTLRVWTCGCSTGEEAYSLAIVIQEAMEATRRPCRLQIFATDLDPNAIDVARGGLFPASIASDVSSERLARFFTHDSVLDAYRVNKPIRDMVIFSEQDVNRDPPFSKLDLIACRNLMIYLNAAAQRKLIPLFHYALREGGYLFLGTSESVGESTALFTPVDRKWKIFSREMAVSGIALGRFPTFSPPSRAARAALRMSASSQSTAEGSLRHVTERAVLAHLAEAAILINGRGDILHIMGRTGRYLEQPTGSPTLNLPGLAREGLVRELSTALHRVVTQRQPITYRGLQVVADGSVTNTDLTVRPVHASPERGMQDLYLVVLQEGLPLIGPVSELVDQGTESKDHVTRLQQELMAKEDYLQTTLEEMETTNEELKSTNEEMQSVNEELQSTNEELETSKEELQSVNEELSTVNAEQQERVAELSRINNDMDNLLAGTGIGTIFVDRALCISRYTPAATQVINLIPSDVGRPVEHLSPKLVGYTSLVEDIAEVLRTLQPREAEVRSKAGTWYLMRLRPYRTTSEVIEGVVLTFVDISERRKAELALAESMRRFQAIFNCVPADLAQFDLAGHLLFVNDHLLQAAGRSREELLSLRFHDLMLPDEGVSFAHHMRKLQAGQPAFQFRHRLISRDGSTQWRDSWISPMRDAEGQVSSVVAVSVIGDAAAPHARSPGGSPP
jgi:two-component system CheB/CheR fusion protein